MPYIFVYTLPLENTPFTLYMYIQGCELNATAVKHVCFLIFLFRETAASAVSDDGQDQISVVL